jgi:hypothetical protein
MGALKKTFRGVRSTLAVVLAAHLLRPADGHARGLVRVIADKLLADAAFHYAQALSAMHHIDSWGREPISKWELQYKVLAEPLPLPPEYQRIVAAYDFYLLHGSDPRRFAEIEDDQASIYFELNDLDRAMKLYTRILARRPCDAMVLRAADVLLRVLAARGQPADVAALIETIDGDEPPGCGDGAIRNSGELLSDAYEAEGDRYFERARGRAYRW